MLTPNDIAIAGCGNVASHLARALQGRVGYIANRTPANAEALAASIGAEALRYDELRERKPAMIIVSLADHAVADVVRAIGRLDYDPLVVHTSGTLPKEVLEPISRRVGILYPLQTFTKDCHVDMARVPFFNEAASVEDLGIIDSVASSISTSVHHADAAKRKSLHIAGVFTSNFTNILLEGVERVLAPEGYDLDVVRPLLEATVEKAFAIGPHAAQTGPARRGDLAVIKAHEQALPDDLRAVYHILSEAILKSHSK
ncbi:MAG: DUF2520 domain-containing protein [Muribaculaceae bacterium]|nr:DUF2520 domain-containing protein [Muribaculaceae bacterium]